MAERLSEHRDLKEKQKFTDPAELKVVMNDMLHCLQERVVSCLDGNLLSAIKCTDQLQTLEDEIDEEEDSLWSDKHLDDCSENEDSWRSKMSEMDDFPENVQPDMPFIGGKQVHRAIEFFGAVMIDSLPEPHKLKHLVPNAVGYGAGGLMRENWEGAARQICMTLMQDLAHPGVNHLVKHIGCILRRMFNIALVDIMEGEKGSKVFRLVPGEVIDSLISECDDMLWDLMQQAASNMHAALKPFYTTIDPNLPTFLTADNDNDGTDDDAAVDGDKEQHLVEWAKSRLQAALSGSSSKAKEMLKNQNKARAVSKKAFLRDKRASMITAEETDVILDRSFQHLIALMEFCLISFRLQINCCLCEEFKTEMKKTFVLRGSKVATLVKPDPDVDERIEELEDQIKGIEASLQEIQRVQKGLQLRCSSFNSSIFRLWLC